MRDDGVQLRARERDRLRRAAPDLRARVRPVGRRARPPRTRVARGRPRGRDRTALAPFRIARRAGGRRRTRRQHARGPHDEPARGARRPRDRGGHPVRRPRGRRRRRRQRLPPLRRRGRVRRDPARAPSRGRARAVLGTDGRGRRRRCGSASARSTRSSNANARPHRSWRRTSRGSSRPSTSRGSRRSNGVRSRPRERWPRRGSRTCSRRRATSRSLPEPRRSRLLARIGELAAELPETLELAERSDVHLWFRDGSGG